MKTLKIILIEKFSSYISDEEDRAKCSGENLEGRNFDLGAVGKAMYILSVVVFHVLRKVTAERMHNSFRQ